MKDFPARIALPLDEEGASVNVYLLRAGGRIWLIDAGFRRGDNFARLAGALADRGLAWEDVCAVVLTHLHPDHMGLILDLQEAASRVDFYYPAGENVGRRDRRAFASWMRRVGLPESLHEDLLDGTGTDPYREEREFLRREGTPLAPGSTLEPGGRTLKVLDARGHTARQIALHLVGEDAVFSGDHLLPNETPNVGLFPTWGSGHPLEHYLRNLGRLQRLGPSRVYPGHGEPFEHVAERIEAVRAHHEQRLEHCRRAVREGGRTAFEVAHEIPWSDGEKPYGTLSPLEGFLALGETLAHLAYLEERGELAREVENGRVRFVPRNLRQTSLG